MVKSYDEMNAEQRFAYDAGRAVLQAVLEAAREREKALLGVLAELVFACENRVPGDNGVDLDDARAAVGAPAGEEG
jgi:hypothetical protein